MKQLKYFQNNAYAFLRDILNALRTRKKLLRNVNAVTF